MEGAEGQHWAHRRCHLHASTARDAALAMLPEQPAAAHAVAARGKSGEAEDSRSGVSHSDRLSHRDGCFCGSWRLVAKLGEPLQRLQRRERVGENTDLRRTGAGSVGAGVSGVQGPQVCGRWFTWARHERKGVDGGEDGSGD